MFLTFLSMSFVGLALLAQAMSFTNQFLIAATVVLAFDFVIGLLTYVRIYGANGDDFRSVHGMARIRHGYTEIAPVVAPYFTSATHDDLASVQLAYGGPSTSTLGDVMDGLSSSGGMIGLITTMVGGVLAALDALLLGASSEVAILLGVVTTAVIFALFLMLTLRAIYRDQATLSVRFPAPTEVRQRNLRQRTEGVERRPLGLRYATGDRIVSLGRHARVAKRRGAVKVARLVAALVVFVSVVGCSYIGANAPASHEVSSPAPSVATSASPSSAPSDTAPIVSIGPSADPTPTTSQATPPATPNKPTLQPTPCCNSSPLPSPSHAAGLAASDRFWDRWVETECWFGVDPLPSSVAEIVRDADLVVRGPIVDLFIGEHWRGSAHEKPYPLVYAKVAIDELVKGAPVSRETGFVEVQMGSGAVDMEEMRSQVPAHDHLWFLNYEDPDRRGEANQSEIVGFVYYAPKEYSTVFREIGGVVELLATARIKEVYGKDEFLLTLDGTDFEDFVQRVREESSQSGRAMTALAKWSPSGEPDSNRFDAC